MPVVRIEPSGFVAHLAEGEPILAGLNRCGFTVRQVGCRRGGCGICKIELLAGQIEYEKVVADSVLTQAERAGGTALTCRAIPRSDVVLHIDEGDVDAAPPGLLRYLNLATASSGRRPRSVETGARPTTTSNPSRINERCD